MVSSAQVCEQGVREALTRLKVVGSVSIVLSILVVALTFFVLRRRAVTRPQKILMILLYIGGAILLLLGGFLIYIGVTSRC